MRALTHDRLCMRLLALFIAAQCMDLALTAVGLAVAEGAVGTQARLVEGNPVLAFLILRLSLPLAALIKLLVYGVLPLGILLVVYLLDRPVALALIIAACALSVGVVGWNLYTLTSVVLR